MHPTRFYDKNNKTTNLKEFLGGYLFKLNNGDGEYILIHTLLLLCPFTKIPQIFVYDILLANEPRVGHSSGFGVIFGTHVLTIMYFVYT
jgi:hypothetical protein